LILQRVDLFYFGGTIQQAHLYVPAEGEPVLMVRKSYDRAKAESSVEKILRLKRPSDIPDILKTHGHALPATLGLELDVLPTNMFFSFQGIFENPHSRLTGKVHSKFELEIQNKSEFPNDYHFSLMETSICCAAAETGVQLATFV